ncbi:NEW3 domain-containing protein [Pyrobaculum sp. 3827-6]|uniref:NEW3 domain-containing protein n=1 Tax=Pyrobaculum sp. 3827-6 TaxID=2983604 RepID=UPI0021D983D2|nr:NEW3 domain-containing protein [Pyrobaculum sp. 3827-6]MCU7787027.1 NEW3 domain-containing protein [Pyrobaculum sp. 3827-6]
MKTKTTIVITALAIALAVAFAAWSETATIQVSASTGYIDLDFQNVDVAYSDYVTVTTSTTGSDSGNDGPPTLTVTINNAYPGASVDVTFDMYNDGTIPVNIRCEVKAPSELTVTISPDTVNDLKPGSSQSATLKIVAGDNVEEQKTYSATVTCTYSQAVPYPKTA